MAAFRTEAIPTETWLQWGVLVASAAVTLWDFDGWSAISTRQVEVAREAGGLALLSVALTGHGMIAAWSGDLEAAASLAAEDEALKQATGAGIAPYGAMLLAAYQGRSNEASELIEATTNDSVVRGEGLGVDLARWTTAILANGLGRYEEALAAAQPASDETPGLYISTWMLPERIEAAVRHAKPKVAAEALEQFTEHAHIADAQWACGVEARSRALLSEGEAAEHLYREAIDRLSTTRVRTELARAHLLFGEWLRRQNRRVDARQQLHTAHDLFASMGADGFGDRARRRAARDGRDVSASAASRRATTSRRRRSTSPGWRATGAPIPRSAPSSTSAPGRSNGTSATCSPSSG